MAIAGVGTVADQTFDRYARIVAEMLGVPMALVSIVEADRQILVGASGLPPHVEASRCTPLSHSFCRHVVADQRALVIDDARRDERSRADPVIQDLAVVAYAGFPLTDTEGHVVGALCAIDHERRHWSDEDLARLDDLAHLCSREIVLHEITHRVAAAERDDLALSGRSRVLLELSEALSDTLTMADVGSAVARAATRGLGCRHAGVWYRPDRNEQSLHGVTDPGATWTMARECANIPLDTDHPVAEVFRTGTPVFLPDRSAVRGRRATHGGRGGDEADQAAVVVPLVVAGATIGVLVLTWAEPNPFLDDDRTTVAALAVYAAQAVHRASLLDERVGAASTMQRALLTALPSTPGLDLGARYRTAAVNDQVGGDWYDATVLGDGSVTLMIGDVVGHDIRAAAAMGQLRSMLRAFSWALDDVPSVNVGRLDRAAKDLDVSTFASLVYARLDLPDPATGRRRLRWTNAGHLPPVLIGSDGRARVLGDGGPADMILGVVPDTPRRDQQVEVERGDTVVFFTDGLIERRDDPIDDGIRRLCEALERYHARPVEDLLDAVLDEVVGVAHADDLALLAVRVQ